MRKLFTIILVAVSLSVNAQVHDGLKKDTTVQVDSSKITALPDTVRHLESTWQSYIPPAIFITYGALSFYVKPIRNLDFSIDRDAQKDHPGNLYPVENYLQYTPIVLTYGLNFIGIQGKNTFIDRSILLGMSEGIFGLATFGLKHSSDRLRPNGSDRLSFPSGHSGSAFVAAEFMSQEFSEKSPWYGIAAYGCASATAILRVYNHKHWFSDIVAGAGFGILSTKAAYALYPLFRNRLFHDKNSKTSTIFMPQIGNGMVGFSFSARL